MASTPASSNDESERATLAEAVQAPLAAQSAVEAEGDESPRKEPKRDSVRYRHCTCPKYGRNLVVCIDGTSNQFSTNNTNVVELYHRLAKNENQLTFYNSGIGTYATPSWKSWHYRKQVLYNMIDLAIAWNFEKILLDAYRWLSEKYRKGDRIFLFGFSRGAYQVRALSAMIEKVGLLHEGNEAQIPFAYQLFAETKPVNDLEKMQNHFKKTFSRENVRVHFVGAWDTVSSVGIFRDKTLPGTTDGMEQVCFFRHALALHERRVKFLPEYARGGLGPEEMAVQSRNGHEPHTKEVWFAGSHSDIGGGNLENVDMTRFGPALRWMSFEATVAGVELGNIPRTWDQSVVRDSLSFWWYPFEYWPMWQLTYRDAESVAPRFHLSDPRHVQHHQRIHQTAFDPTLSFPAWCAHLPDKLKLVDSEDHLRKADMVEDDPYISAEATLTHIADCIKNKTAVLLSEITSLKTSISTGPGQDSLRDVPNAPQTLVDLIMSLRHAFEQEPRDDQEARAAVQSIRIVLAALKYSAFDTDYDQEYPFGDLHRIVSSIAPIDAEVAERLLCALGSRSPLRHGDDFVTFAYFPSGSRLVTGADDGTLLIWDRDTRQPVFAPMTGHTRRVWSISISPDGKRIASASDKTVRIWHAESGEPFGKPLIGHTNTLNSVSFSPDGDRVVSGADDWTIRIWDLATGTTTVDPILAHSDEVWSVAYSPDGSRIVSSSRDGTICLWDAQTGRGTGPKLRHNAAVASVAFSPDSSRIASGSHDATVRIWDAATGLSICVMIGHLSATRVAFSPDGTRIASGSWDGSVRLWNLETGEQLDIFTCGATFRSVAFSPDGKEVAAASEDGRVRIWDATGAWTGWDAAV